MKPDPTAGNAPSPTDAARTVQQRTTARGCLLALVLDGAAFLGGALWLVGVATGSPSLRSAGAFAFFAFTAATAGVLLFLVITGNTRRQRQLREAAAAAEDAAAAAENRPI